MYSSTASTSETEKRKGCGIQSQEVGRETHTTQIFFVISFFFFLNFSLFGICLIVKNSFGTLYSRFSFKQILITCCLLSVCWYAHFSHLIIIAEDQKYNNRIKLLSCMIIPLLTLVY